MGCSQCLAYMYSGVAHYELSREPSPMFVGRLCQSRKDSGFTETPCNSRNDEPGQAF